MASTDDLAITIVPVGCLRPYYVKLQTIEQIIIHLTWIKVNPSFGEVESSEVLKRP